MKVFHILKSQTITQLREIEVKAETEEEALNKVHNGEGSCIDVFDDAVHSTHCTVLKEFDELKLK